MKFAKGFKGRYFSLAAIAATVSCVQLHAQNTQAIQLEKIIVSAANTEQEEDDVTEDVTVITADEIQERGYQTLKDALASVPGISFTSNGGFGQPTSLYLRGMKSSRTLVLIDGIRANDFTGLNGGTYEHYLLDNVERIEVIKGPQSGVWGADASAGVINIITKKSTGKNISFVIKGGNYNTKELSFAFGNKIDNFDFLFSLNHFDTDGFSVAEPSRGDPEYGKHGGDLGYENDGYTNTIYNLKLGYDLSDKDRFMGSVLAIDARLDYDSSYYDSVTNRYKSKDDPVPENETKERFYSFNYIHETDKNYLEAFYQYSIFDRSYYEGSTSDFHGTIKDIGLKDRFDYGTSDFIQLGGGYQQYRYKSSSLYGSMNKSFDNRNLYLTNVNKFFGNKTLINESIRYDDYRPFQDKTTYKIGVKQYLFEETYLSVNYGTGYNVPSFYQLFGTYGPNPNLKPESTTGYDVFVSRKGIKVGYFKSWVEDLITYVNNQYTNIDGESKFEGIEASYSSQFFDNFMINIAYTHLIRAEDSQENDLPRRAKNMFNYSLSWYPTDKHTININGTYVGKRYDDTEKTIQTGKYNVTNVVLRHNFAKDFTGEIEVRNLFDRFYQEVDGYGTAGRSIYVGISAKY